MTFLLAFLFYSVLICQLAGFIHSYNSGLYYWMDRDTVGRRVFGQLMGCCYFAFIALVGLTSATTLVGERDKKTEVFLRSSPISIVSLLFQKLLTPLVVVWILYFGILPMLALVFLFGGVSFKEFALKLISLAVVLNTSCMIGMFTSARFSNSAKSIGWTIGILFSLFVIGSVVVQLLMQLPGPFTVLLAGIFLPFWLLTIPSTIGLDSMNMGVINNPVFTFIFSLVPSVPGAPSLFAHLIVQAVLFWKTIRI